jgi:hypothetical protein
MDSSKDNRLSKNKARPNSIFWADGGLSEGNGYSLLKSSGDSHEQHSNNIKIPPSRYERITDVR